MKNRIKYLINITSNIKSIKEVSQYLAAYSTIFFSEDGKEVTMVDKKTNKKFTTNSCIKHIKGDNCNYYTITIYQENKIYYLEFFDKLINEFIYNQSDMPEGKFLILEDGISMYYASKAYPKLFYTETIIRAFITEIMSFFGPKDWGKMGKKLVENKQQNKEYKNTFLYSSDFKHLDSFLTKLYKEEDAEIVLKDVREKIEKIDSRSKISEVIEIKNFIQEKNHIPFGIDL